MLQPETQGPAIQSRQPGKLPPEAVTLNSSPYEPTADSPVMLPSFGPRVHSAAQLPHGLILPAVTRPATIPEHYR